VKIFFSASMLYVTQRATAAAAPALPQDALARALSRLAVREPLERLRINKARTKLARLEDGLQAHAAELGELQQALERALALERATALSCRRVLDEALEPRLRAYWSEHRDIAIEILRSVETMPKYNVTQERRTGGKEEGPDPKFHVEFRDIKEFRNDPAFQARKDALVRLHACVVPGPPSPEETIWMEYLHWLLEELKTLRSSLGLPAYLSLRKYLSSLDGTRKEIEQIRSGIEERATAARPFTQASPLAWSIPESEMGEGAGLGTPKMRIFLGYVPELKRRGTYGNAGTPAKQYEDGAFVEGDQWGVPRDPWAPWKGPSA